MAAPAPENVEHRQHYTPRQPGKPQPLPQTPGSARSNRGILNTNRMMQLDLPEQALLMLEEIAIERDEVERQAAGGAQLQITGATASYSTGANKMVTTSAAPTSSSSHLEWFESLLKEYHARLHTKEGKTFTKVTARLKQWERQKSLARLTGAIRTAGGATSRTPRSGRHSVKSQSSFFASSDNDEDALTEGAATPGSGYDEAGGEGKQKYAEAIRTESKNSTKREVEQLRKEISFALFTRGGVATPTAGSKNAAGAGEAGGEVLDGLDGVVLHEDSKELSNAGGTKAQMETKPPQMNFFAPKFTKREKLTALAAFLVSIFAVVLMCVWKPHQPSEVLHTTRLTKYNSFITSPVYTISESQPLVMPLEDHNNHDSTHVEVIDLKMFAAQQPRTDSDSVKEKVQWKIYNSLNEVVKSGSLLLSKDEEVEYFETLDVESLHPVKAEFTLTRETTAGVALTGHTDFLGLKVQLVCFTWLGKWRLYFAVILFLGTFALIISEVVHRVYVTLVAATIGLFLNSVVHEQIHLKETIAMIDFGTLMLLFSMMINVNFLAQTGFFQWFSVKIVIFSKCDVRKLFFLLANITGILSAFLDNVTVVMLMGPLTFQLCKAFRRNPKPFYLAQVICATVGGTSTLIGDPPNIVIGYKLKVGFVDFLIYNAPLIVVLLPLSSYLLYRQFREEILAGEPDDEVEDQDDLRRINLQEQDENQAKPPQLQPDGAMAPAKQADAIVVTTATEDEKGQEPLQLPITQRDHATSSNIADAADSRTSQEAVGQRSTRSNASYSSSASSNGVVFVDLEKLKRDNRITDHYMLLKVTAVFAGIFLALCLSPVHQQEAAWFTFLGMLLLCFLLTSHEIHHVLESVEWDVLMFFASLFVLVECLAELGLIRLVGECISNVISSIDDESARLPVAMLLILWVSSMGSAFLESLPYTTTMCYLLLALKTEEDTTNKLGFEVENLSYALSVGACIGGIGSIMGSSANLVAMGICSRYLPADAPLHHKIQGKDFLKYGFPVLLILTAVSSVYQYVIFSVVQ
ncbi:unnamed protein product [Amoebophrya sp. A120]|nr:unnamed protein product [Amoebophrya sp. A120]|eukprot:GSA120T00020555001.1